jgi:DNA polymerase V
VRLPLTIANLARRLADKTLRAGDINGILDVEPRIAAAVPLMNDNAVCGFPSPADDYLDRPLDFNELLIENPAATFAVRIAGESMTGAGIFPGDIAVVDRSRTADDGSVACASEWGVHRQALPQEGNAPLASR